MAGLGKAMFGLNAEMQTATVQLAGMAAIAKKTSIADQMSAAADAVEHLSKRTVDLPGTLKEYATLAKQIALPIMKAGGDWQKLEDITVSTMTAMKIKDVDVGTAARSIMRLFNGSGLQKDRVSQFYADMLGMSVKQLNVLGKTNKQELLRRLYLVSQSKFIKEYNEAQNKTFAGQKEELGERAQRFFARIGKGLFEQLTGGLTSINDWLKNNEERVNAFADSIAGALVSAFRAMGSAIGFLVENWDTVKDVLTVIAVLIGGALLKSTLMWMAAWAPFFIAVYAGVKLFQYLRDKIGDTGAAIVAALAVGGILLFIAYIKAATMAMLGLSSASSSMGAASLPWLLPLLKLAGAAAFFSQLRDNGGGTGAGRHSDNTGFFGSGSEAGRKEAANNMMADRKAAFDPEWDNMSSMSQLSRNNQWGELSLQKMYQDAASVAQGANFGHSFGRANSVNAGTPALTVGETHIEINVKDVKDAKDAADQFRDDKAQQERRYANASVKR